MHRNSRSKDASPSSGQPPDKGDGTSVRPENRAFLFCPKCCQTLCQELADGMCPQCKERIVQEQRNGSSNEPKPAKSPRGLET